MSDQLLRAAQIEDAALLRELRQTPTFRKYEAVRALVTAYGDVEQTALVPVSAPVMAARPAQREGSLSAVVTKFADEYMRKQGRRAPAPEIVQAAIAAGIEINNDKQFATISSALSHSDLFNNVRGKGYGLAEWGVGDGPRALTVSLDASESEQHTPLRVDLKDSRGTAQSDVRPNEANSEELALGYSVDDDGRIKEEAA